jgi:ABC-type polar amino acid transport system ATPase subunit
MGFARDVCDRVVIMSDAEIVEQGPPEVIFSAPTHERTQRFLTTILNR